MKTHFTGEFSARRPVTITVALVLTMVGMCFAVMWMPQMSRQMDLAHTVGAFGATLFILAFLGGGLFLLYKVVKNEKTTLSITSDGLSYGSNFYRWEDITEIGIMQEYWHRKDLYCTTRFHPGRLDLVLSKGLSPEQIETVFRALRSEVIATYPHVQLVDTSHGQADV